jgi:hypothetical protein
MKLRVPLRYLPQQPPSARLNLLNIRVPWRRVAPTVSNSRLPPPAVSLLAGGQYTHTDPSPFILQTVARLSKHPFRAPMARLPTVPTGTHRKASMTHATASSPVVTFHSPSSTQ